MTDQFRINVEADYVPALCRHLTHELASRFTRAQATKGAKLAAQGISATLDGEEFQARISDPKGEVRVRMVFPIFGSDGGYSLIQCSCLTGRAVLDEVRCWHMWAAQSQLLKRLEATVTVGRDAPKDKALRLLAEFSNACDEAAAWGEERDYPERVVFRVASDGSVYPWLKEAAGVRCLTWRDWLGRSGLWEGDPTQKLAARLKVAVHGPEEEIDSFGALWDLAGVLNVFWEDLPSTPCLLERGKPCLQVVWEKSGILLKPAVDGITDDALILSGGLAVRTAKGLRLARLNQREESLFRALLEGAFVYPAKKKMDLIKLLARVQESMTVHLSGDGSKTAPSATNHLFLRFVPQESGDLLVSLRVKPGTWGPYLPPGVGAASIIDWFGEKPITRERDLDDEKARGERLITALHLFRYPLANSDSVATWRLVDREDALDVITQVETLKDPSLVVEWPKMRPPGLEVVHESNPQLNVQVKGQKNQWFSVEGEARFGDAGVPLATLLAALKDKRRYLQLTDGRWVSLMGKFRAQLMRLAAAIEGDGDTLLLSRAASIDLAESIEETGGDKSWRSWQGQWKDLGKKEVPVPKWFKATLRSYQKDGIIWLWRLAELGLGALLADDMGLGKTVQTLAVLAARSGKGPQLIVAPTSVLGNWAEEAARFAPELPIVMYRDGERLARLEHVTDDSLVLTSYGVFLRDEALLAKVKWQAVVFDEAQALKNPEGKTAQAAAALPAAWKLALTGTPVENHLGELWSIFHIIQPGLLPVWNEFQDRFMRPIGDRGDSDALDQLRARIKPFILRRLKKDHLKELPPKTEIALRIPLSPEERALYEATRLQAVESLKNQEGPGTVEILAELTRLRQLVCHPKLVHPDWMHPSSKTDKLMQLCRDLAAAGHRTLIFSQFTAYLKIVTDRLSQEKLDFLYLDGSTPAAQRQELVRTFQEGDVPFFLISLKAGGVGLNLTAADYVLVCDPWWNPQVENQATDRAHRMGQKKPVTVYRLVASQTIEEKILRLQDSKKRLVDEVLSEQLAVSQLGPDAWWEILRGGSESIF